MPPHTAWSVSEGRSGPPPLLIILNQLSEAQEVVINEKRIEEGAITQEHDWNAHSGEKDQAASSASMCTNAQAARIPDKVEEKARPLRTGHAPGSMSSRRKKRLQDHKSGIKMKRRFKLK